MISVTMKRLIAYYLLLLSVLFVMTRPGYLPPVLIRYALFFAVFIPAVAYPRILPAVTLLFCGVTINSFARVLYMDEFIILGIVLMGYLLCKKKGSFLFNFLAVLFYFFICSLAHADVSPAFIWFIIAAMLMDMVVDAEDLRVLFHAYLLLSLFLGILFLTHRQEFAVQYGAKADELELYGWINNNVFGGAIAAGGVLAMAYLTNVLNFVRNRTTGVLSIATAVIVFVVLGLNASRGAFLAFVLSAVIMVMTTKAKLYYKMFIIIAAGAIVYYFYTNDTFALLQARMGDDTLESAGGRTNFWEAKLTLFLNDSNILKLLFGIGQTECVKLATSTSTHNDLVTAFIAYGFIGLVLFVYFVYFYPIRIACREKRKAMMALLVYLIIENLVLEPIFRGYIIEIMFYFFVLKYAMIRDEETNQMIAN